MSHTGSVPPRFMFERLCTGRGEIPTIKPPLDRGDFLRVYVAPGGELTRRATLCIELYPESVMVALGGRVSRSARNLRYVGPDGQTRRIFRCCECGRSAHLLEEQIGGPKMGACELCRAELSTTRCAMWHTWGRCPECSDEAWDEIPFAEEKSVDALAVASHVG